MKHKIHRALLLAVVAAHAAFARADDHAHGAGEKPAAGHDHHDHAGAEEAHADEVKLTEAAVLQNDIRVAPAESKSLTGGFVAPSRVAFDADRMAHVGSFVTGRVVAINVRVGDAVRSGDPLIVVESPELGRAQSDYLQRRTEAEIAAAATAPAQESYDRAKRLYDESGGIALAEVQKRDVERRAADGQAASSKAALRAAENALRLLGFSKTRLKTLADTGEIDPRFEIRAPIDGKVVERDVTPGERVSPEQDKLLVLADTRTLWVLADVPEARLADIGVGSRADVQLVALAGESISGEVSLVSPEIDPATRTARLRIVVDNAAGRLRPGMFAKSVIQGRAGDATVAVPEAAVQTVEGKPGVFVPVAGEANTFARRAVVVGPAVGGFVPVLSGLRAGEPVVISGSFILKAELGKAGASHEH